MKYLPSIAVIFIAIGLQACSGNRSNTGPLESVVPGSAPEGTGLVSDEFYQPTNHALVAIQNGTGTPLTAEWQRTGSSEGFSVVLNPGKYETFGLNPGQYVLVTAKAESDTYEFGGDNVGGPVLAVEPGDVVDAGILLVNKKGGRVTVQIKDDPTAARAAIQARYPLQARAMKSKPLQVPN